MVMSRGELFSPEIVSDLINKTKGASALSQLSASQPIPFNGQKEFTFSMAKEIDVVAENGKKTEGGVIIEPRIMKPIKVEYGARFSDEFLYSADEQKMNILKAFNDGFALKLAKGLDLMAMLGINPRTGKPSDVIAKNDFKDKVTTIATYVKEATTKEDNNADEAISNAINEVAKKDFSVSGVIANRDMSIDLSKLTVNGDKNGTRIYPQLAWGANPGSLNGMPLQITNNISFGDSDLTGLVGDFATNFRWGYSKQIPMEVIRYGDPDNSGLDLKGYNQVYLRAEVYLGWGILDPNAFALIKKGAEKVTTGKKPGVGA
ncbi:MAG: phage major capsid protein [Aerococcus sp.]|nr:phage major capsid protein [Aerococcus sp.]